MALTPEQIKELKTQLFEQVKHLPADKKLQAEAQISALTEQQLEAMLAQEQKKSETPSKGIFRQIIDKDIPSRTIDESKDAIAVLDIRPISEGNSIIIPKRAVSDIKYLPNSILSFAKKVGKRISRKLKSKGAEIQTEFKFGELIINIIPVYDKSVNIMSPRESPEEKELDKIYSKLKVVKKQRVIKLKSALSQKTTPAMRLSRRIP